MLKMQTPSSSMRAKVVIVLLLQTLSRGPVPLGRQLQPQLNSHDGFELHFDLRRDSD